ncbi:MAG: hypothetical protein MUC62_08115 [Candidatus Thermoplasmatota archaeon]|nr:hypothetical protein [Candidatus Thermoplasmatota archaeon]
MPEYYLDLETTGLDPRTDTIVTISYQRLGMVTGRDEGNLNILMTWESSEKEVLELFLPIFTGSGPFSFVAIGVNVPFIYSFLVERARRNGLEAPDPLYLLGAKPFLDLKPLLVMMNRGSFKGAALDRFVNISVPSESIPQLYRDGRYGEVLEHVREKASELLRLYRHLKERMPELASAYRGTDEHS